MPLELDKLFSSGVGFFNKDATIGGILSSTIGVSIIIVLCVIFIIMVMYPTKENTPLTIFFRMALYMLVSICAILFLHDGLNASTLKKQYNDAIRNDVVTSAIGGSVRTADKLPLVTAISTISPLNLPKRM